MPKRLKVVALTPPYFEYAIRQAIGLCVENDVLLITGDSYTNYFDATATPLPSNMAIKAFPANNSVQRLAFLVRAMWAILWFRPDILQCQESPTCYDLAIAWVLRLFVPFALVVHDPTPHSGNDSRAAQGRRWIRALQRGLADLILVNGDYCRDNLVQASAPGTVVRTKVTRHGVVMCPAADQRRAPPPDRIILFGRMEHYKGLGVFLDALRRLDQNGVPFSAMVAGRGEELDLLAPELERIPNVHIRNEFLSVRDLIDEIQAARIVVMPYLNATQSGVATSAFANGRPVIASNVGGLSEIVIDGANGLLIPPDDAVALADAITRALNDDVLYRRLCDGVAETVRQALDWDTIGHELTAMYRQLLQAR